MKLDAVLLSAKAASARAVIGSADREAGWAKTSLKLDYVRVYCRQLRAALADLDSPETTGNVDRARANCRELRMVLLELRPSAMIPFHCDQPSCLLLRSPRTTCWLDHLEGVIAAPHHSEAFANGAMSAPVRSRARSVRRSAAGSSERKPSSKDARASASLLRQSIDLLILVLAYLAYFFIDVQLQILTLRSIFTLPPE